MLMTATTSTRTAKWWSSGPRGVTLFVCRVAASIPSSASPCRNRFIATSASTLDKSSDAINSKTSSPIGSSPSTPSLNRSTSTQSSKNSNSSSSNSNSRSTRTSSILNTPNRRLSSLSVENMYSHPGLNAGNVSNPTQLDNAAAQSFTFYDTTVEEYASKQVRSLAMKEIIEFGKRVSPAKLIRSARYLQEEMLTRMARPIRSMQSLPYIVGVNPHIKSLFHLYWNSFQELRSLPQVSSVEEEQRYTEALSKLVTAHTPTIRTLAEGVREIRNLPGSVDFDFERLDQFINKFLCERIARRMLAEQHMALHHPADGWIGIIQLECSLAKVVDRCMQHAQQVCFKTYGTYPEYSMGGDVDTKCPYIPIHLEYILFEVFKNSLRAVVEHHRNTPSLPDVNIRICSGDYATIHVSDQGGGIPPTVMPQVWSYGYTTVKSTQKKNNDSMSLGMQFQMAQSAANDSPMAGFGFGLPMARLYARYLGGELDIYSMPGYGTDTYIRLKPITEQEEHIII